MFFVSKKCVPLPAFSKLKHKSMKNILLIIICALFTINSQASTITTHTTISAEELIISSDPPLYGFVVDTTITGFGTLTYPTAKYLSANSGKDLNTAMDILSFRMAANTMATLKMTK